MEINLSDEERIQILNGRDLYGIMLRILLRADKIDQNREHFWVVGLASDNHILFVELISMGSVKQTVVEPMEVFSFALQKRAVNIVLVHNHPSYNLMASEMDKDITDRLYQVGLIVDCKVIDHLIISPKGYMSFLNTGLLEELSKSTKYVPPYVLKERWEKEALELGAKIGEKIGEEKGEKNRTTEIAKEMKRKGYKSKEIAEVTGLSIEEIDKLRVRKRKG